MLAVIQSEKISKKFVVSETATGIWGTLKGLFCPKRHEVMAIRELTFEVKGGERVAFIGPNGAGKSTLFKMLTGILHPTSGRMEVLGFVPWKDREKLGYSIGTVFGQRTQLWYHLPPSDTFDLLSKIYEIEGAVYRERLKELVGLFEIEHLLGKPVRQLSLGERMRCEIVASLLHAPKILFLDEPTIGLDINAKLMIRGLLNKLSKEYGTTLFLTSHDTADIEQVCDRVIVLDKGAIICDTTLKELKKSYMKKKKITLVMDEEKIDLSMAGVKVLENGQHHFCCEIETDTVPIDKVVQETLKRTALKDVTIEDLSMEEVISILYGKKA